MKIPKASTIRGRINYYAYRAGFLIRKNPNGTYSLFDNTMQYWTHHNLLIHDAVRVVTDELYAQSYSNK